MKFVNILLGLACIVFGVGLIRYYQILKQEKKRRGSTFRIRTAGICFVIIGTGFILREF